MPNVVISETFGGFGLSSDAIARIRELGTALPDHSAQRNIPRDNAHLVQTVRELGRRASGKYAALAIVEVPDGVAWHIHEYDGFETVHEEHRAWSSEGQVECS